jgi:putative addiction module CopG family antidote
MAIELPADVKSIVDQAIASGRGTDEADIIRQALQLYSEFQQRREALRREIERGIQSGASIPGELVFQELESLARELAASSRENR